MEAGQQGRLTGLLEEVLGSDGEAGGASNSLSCVILTTQTRCLMTGNNKTHTATVNVQKKQPPVLLSPPQTEDGTNNSYQREKQKKWEESKEDEELRTPSTRNRVQKGFYLIVR